jgi:hypothetical protein
MGDEYEAAEAAYWENQEQYEADAELHRMYGASIPRDHYSLMPAISITRGGIQWPISTASPAVTGTIHQSTGWTTHNKTEEMHVQNDQDILTQAEELRAEAERLERIVAEREKYGEDPFKNGTVLKVEMRYRTGSRRSFAYGVVKVGGKFYLTGKLVNARTTGSDTASGFTWEQFVAWLSQGDATVWQAKSLQQVF